MAGNYIIDNMDGRTMAKAINDCIFSGIKIIKIATGYWDLHGVALIADKLETVFAKNNAKLQLLIGTDPYFYAHELDPQKNPKYKNCDEKDYPGAFIVRDLEDEAEKTDGIKVKVGSVKLDDIQLNEANKRYQDNLKAIELLLKYKDNIEVRKYNKEFLHAKCYIFIGSEKIPEGHPGAGEEHTYARGIIGSSNFTEAGLTKNAELNHLEYTDDVVIRDCKETEIPKNPGHNWWFKQIWNKAEKWDEFFDILKNSSINKDRVTYKNCEEVYIKCLQNAYADYVDSKLDGTFASYLPTGSRKKLKYQIAAAKVCVNKMKEHGGFLLADVVGLGKTTVGALIMRRFLDMSDEERSGRKKEILIIVPPTLKNRWEKELELYRYGDKTLKDMCKFVTIGSIQKVVAELEDVESTPEDEDNSIDSGKFDDDTNLGSTDYGLIIIDESHKFRNHTTSMYKKLNGEHYDDWRIKQKGLIQKIKDKTGEYPWVGLLSATPLNNSPRDIRNQIYLFEQCPGQSKSIKAGNHGSNLHAFFQEKIKQFDDKLKAIKNNKKIEQIDEKLEAIKNKDNDPTIEPYQFEQDKDLQDVLSQVMVRRTRRDISAHFADDMASNGWKFPTVQPPENDKYDMNEETRKLFEDTMTILSGDFENDTDNDNKLGFYQYRAEEFLIKENAVIEENHGQMNLFDSNTKKQAKDQQTSKDKQTSEKQASIQLAHMMQVQHAKWLDSSFYAFREALHGLLKRTLNCITMFERDAFYFCPDRIDVHKIIEKYPNPTEWEAKLDEEIEKKRTPDSKNACYKQNSFKPGFYEGLVRDAKILNGYKDNQGQDVPGLVQRWDALKDYDPKYDDFKSYIKKALANPDNLEKKLVVFTESVRTATILEKRLKEDHIDGVFMISANRRNSQNTEILEYNFDPTVEKNKQRNDIRILITTDVLAEGIDLHRANFIVNYDTPWNSTKLFQRVGRVNRIGTKADKIYIRNFRPNANVDQIIHLFERAHIKLQEFHSTLGTDNPIYSALEQIDVSECYNTIDDMTNDVIQKQKQMNDALSDDTQYIQDLQDYKEKHPDDYDRILNKNVVTAQRCDSNPRHFLLVDNVYYIVKENDAHEFEAECCNKLEFFKELSDFEPSKEHIVKSLPGDIIKKINETVKEHYKIKNRGSMPQYTGDLVTGHIKKMKDPIIHAALYLSPKKED